MTSGIGRSDSMRLTMTSWSSGSPVAPGSLVRSSTDIPVTVSGIAARRAAESKGRYNLTITTPTFSPSAASFLTASAAAPTPEPIITMIRSASGAPT
jgi:hypothetical protein